VPVYLGAGTQRNERCFLIDVQTEKLISLKEASRILPTGRRGQPFHISCLLRWILVGANRYDGERVRLDGVRIGARWVTSKEALARFAEQLTPASTDAAPAPPRTPLARTRAVNCASRRLEADGI